MPVNRPQALVAEERSRTAGECFVIENRLISGLNLSLVGSDKGLIGIWERAQCRSQGVDVVEIPIEVVPSVAVLRDDIRISIGNKLRQKR